MRISELKAKELLKLKPIGCVETACDLGDRTMHHKWSYYKERCVDVQHRGLDYVVGCWAGWEGAFWVVECGTGLIFRGPLNYIQDVIRICSAAHHEPHEVR